MEHVPRGTMTVDRERLAPPCPKCGRPNLRWPQRRCHACHAADQRAYRKRVGAILRRVRG